MRRHVMMVVTLMTLLALAMAGSVWADPLPWDDDTGGDDDVAVDDDTDNELIDIAGLKKAAESVCVLLAIAEERLGTDCSMYRSSPISLELEPVFTNYSFSAGGADAEGEHPDFGGQYYYFIIADLCVPPAEEYTYQLQCGTSITEATIESVSGADGECGDQASLCNDKFEDQLPGDDGPAFVGEEAGNDGCGCRVGGRSTPWLMAVLAISLLFWIALRRSPMAR